MNSEVATQTVEESSTTEIFEVNVASLQTGNSPFFNKPNDDRPHMKVLVNGEVRTPLVDTGAMVCVLAITSKAELKHFNEELLPIKVFINTVQSRSPTLGVMHLTYAFGEKQARVPTVVIITPKSQFIVGMNFCRAFGIYLDISSTFYAPKSETTIFDAISITNGHSTTVRDTPKCGSGSPSPVTSYPHFLKMLIRDATALLGSANTDQLVRQTLVDDVSLASSDVEAIEDTNHDGSSSNKCINKMANESEESGSWEDALGGNASDESAFEEDDTDDESAAIRINETELATKRLVELLAENQIIDISQVTASGCETSGTAGEIQTADGNDDTERDVLPEKRESVTQPHELERAQRERLDRVIELFPYTPETGPLNKNPNYVQHINLVPDAIPVRRQQYPLSPYVLDEVRIEISKLLERDIIEPIETSPWRWPFLWVKKKNGGGRICLDARGLNKLTIPDAYPSLNVDQILRNLPKARYITGLDMTQAFHQIEIVRGDRPKTAFAVDNRFYCYKRAVMGFRNSPADLTKMLSNIFHDMAPEVYHYVDDFVIMSPTFEQHVKTLTEVANRLKAHNLTISREKSCFCYKRLSFLGYVLTENGLEANQDRIAPILNYKRPENVRDVRRLVGLANWYRRFIPRAAEMLSPLSDLITKDSKQKVVWSNEAEQSFEALKRCLTTAPILVPADYRLPFKIFTDASLIAGAGILTQNQEGQERVIAFHSVKFNKAQRNYSATERECLAVLSSVERFRPWVDGVPFKVVTDHASLKWLQNLKEPHGKLARWAVRLQAFDITFEHRPGKQMDAPDALSRAIDLIDIEPNINTKDRWYNHAHEMARRGESDFYMISDGYLYRRGKFQASTGDRIWTMCIPNELVDRVLHEKHDASCHPGFWKTLHSVKTCYYWRGMHQRVYEYVTKCVNCRLIKPTNEATRVPTGQYTEPKRIGQILYVDFIGKLPASRVKKHMHAVVCMDGFSRYVTTRSFVNASAEKLIEFLEQEVFFRFDVPELLISDNGAQFRSKLFVEFLARYKVRQMRTPYYHAQSNAVEASNKTLKTGLRARLLELDLNHRDWASILPYVTMTMNTTPLTSIGCSAFFCMHGREKAKTGDEHRLIFDVNPEIASNTDRMAMIREDVANQSRTAFETNRKVYDTRAQTRKFKDGDVVYVHNRVLSSGPEQYTRKLAPLRRQVIVKEKLGNDTYALVDLQGNDYGHYHANDIMIR